MRRAPTRSDVLGASPRRALHADPLRLDLARSLSEQQRLHDMSAIRQMFGAGELGGYWEPALSSYYEDSAGTVPASVGGVVGAWVNQISGGPSAVQATTANKPFLRKTPETSRYWLDGNTTTANLTATFPSSLGSQCTIARLDPELGVQWSENQTIGTTFNIITPYAYHGPMLIINRALTASEKAIVARVMGRFMPQLGPNLIDNGDMEVGLPANVTVTNPAEQACTRVTSDPKFGAAALALVKTTSNIAQPSVLFPVPQSIRGKQVIAAVKSYSTTSTGTGYALTSWPTTGSVSFSSLVVSNQTWRHLRGAGVMPSNATHMRHGVGTAPSYSAGTEVYRLDDVVLREII